MIETGRDRGIAVLVGRGARGGELLGRPQEDLVEVGLGLVLVLGPVVLEAPVPVLGHLGHVVREHRQHLLDRVLVDHATQTGLARVRARDHDGHVVVEDLDREVLAYLAEDVLLFLLDHLAGPMMGIDHVVADLEIDVDDFALDLEIFDLQGCLGNRVLLRHGPVAGPHCVVHVCKYRSTRLISCRQRRPSRISFARISPTPSTDSSSGSVAARISSSPRNSRTMFCTTSFGSRGMRPRRRKPRGETGKSSVLTLRSWPSSSARRPKSSRSWCGRRAMPSSAWAKASSTGSAR